MPTTVKGHAFPSSFYVPTAGLGLHAWKGPTKAPSLARRDTWRTSQKLLEVAKGKVNSYCVSGTLLMHILEVVKHWERKPTTYQQC